MLFEGVCTALVTPLNLGRKIDFAATEKLIEYQLSGGIKTILILGSTGEGMLLAESEREVFIKFVKKLLPKGVKLIVAAGGNEPKAKAEQILKATELGADACLVTTPAFMKCTQNALVEHFYSICKMTDTPIIVYNIPSRSGVNILPETMQKICQISGVVGLKEANGNIDHICQMFHAVGGKTAIYCGNDNLNGVFKGLGANGTISVTSNAFPEEMRLEFEKDNLSLKINDNFFAFNNLMFCEPNPIPIKYVLWKMGIIKNILMPPLTKLEKNHQKMIDSELKKLEAK